MKVEVINAPEFKPVSIKIDFDSKKELEMFWHQVNVNQCEYIKENKLKHTEDDAYDVIVKIWTAVNDLCKAMGFNFTSRWKITE